MENYEVREAERKAIQHQTRSENRILRRIEKSFEIFFVIVASLALLCSVYIAVITVIARCSH